MGNPDLSISSLSDLSLLKRIALGRPGSVPAGQYAKQAMTHAGVYKSLLDAHKLVIAKDVRQALLYAERNEVGAAFVYKTDALLVQTARILYPVPTPFYDRVSYPMALTVRGGTSPLAKVFYAFLACLDIQVVFSLSGAVIASAVVGFPLLVRSLRIGMEEIDKQYLNVARTLGAGWWDRVYYMVFNLAGNRNGVFGPSGSGKSTLM